MTHTRLFYKASSLLAFFVLAASMQAESFTVRIRFANGRTGKTLHVKYMALGRGGFEHNGYTVDRVEQNSLLVTFHDVTTFSFQNEGYYRCDSKKETDPPTIFSLKEIIKTGVVAPNVCSAIHAQPLKGELLIYSRHAHFLESLSNMRGLFFGA